MFVSRNESSDVKIEFSPTWKLDQISQLEPLLLYSLLEYIWIQPSQMIP